jgi:outer membrane protein assembly factor BamB
MLRQLLTVIATLMIGATSLAQSPPIVGWRRDGTGHYPEAAPPTKWGINSPAVAELSSQSGKPKASETGKPIPDGVIKDWLLLIDYSGASGSDEAGEKLAASQPDANEKVGDESWKTIKADRSTLDLNQFTDKTKRTKESVAYVHAYIHSASGKPVALQSMWDGLTTAWVNGKQIFKGASGQTPAIRSDLKLVKGWNRLLLKINAGGTAFKHLDANWFCRVDFYGTDQKDLKKTNILWSIPVHGTGISSPIIVGNKLFFTEEGNNLSCADKLTGKVLWRRTTTYADAATAEEKKANPDVFQKIDPLMAKIKQLNTANSSATKEIEKEINQLMRKLDRDKYMHSGPGDGGASAPTPISDGQHVYVLNAEGILTCHDLEGNRKWVTVLQFKTEEHGAAGSPLLIDGKIVVFYIHWTPSMPTIAAGIDAKTGAVAWNYNKEVRISYHCSPVKLMLNGEPCFATPAWIGKAKDGTILYDRGGFGSEPTVISSSVVHENHVISFIDTGLDLVTMTPKGAGATRKVPIPVGQFPHWYGAWKISSPLYHDGLIYCVSDDGVLSVVDFKEGKIVYQKFLDLGLYMHHNLYSSRGGAASSVTLAGKNIYIFGNAGVGLVIQPGREYKQVARNRIENFLQSSTSHGYGHQETMGSCPVFEGKRMYLMAESTLYCIGEP